MPSGNRPRFIQSDPWILARDVQSTIQHLVEVLGFDHWFDPEEDMPVGGVRRDDLVLRVRKGTSYADAISRLDLKDRPSIRILVDQIDGLYQDHKRRGATIAEEIGDRPWGDREYTVEEINGHLLTFTEDIASVRERS